MEMEMEKKESTLVKLQEEVKKSESSLLKIGFFLEEIARDSAEEMLCAYIICAESENPELKIWAESYSEKIKVRELESLLNCQISPSMNVREFAKKKYELFSSKDLVTNLETLILALGSEYTLKRFYASELADKIEPKDLIDQIKRLYGYYKNNCGDVRRVARKLLIKTIDSLDSKSMLENLETICLIKANEKDSTLLELAIWAYLEVGNKTWGFKRLCLELPELMKFKDSFSSRVQEITAYLFIGIVDGWPLEILEDHLDYLASMINFSKKETSWKSREMCLAILDSYDVQDEQQLEKLYSKYEYIVVCSKAESFHVRRMARSILKKIPKDMFFRNVKELISWHGSGYNEIRPVIRKILFGIKDDKYIDIIEHLIDVQKSGDSEQRYLTAELASRISREKLLTKKDYIKERCDSGYEDVRILARELNFFIS